MTKWIYDFIGVDLIVHANTKEEALEKVRKQGIVFPDKNRIRQAPESPQGVMSGGGID